MYYCRGATIQQIEQEIIQIEEKNVAYCIRGVLAVLVDAKTVVDDVKGGKIAAALQEGIVLLKDVENLKPICEKIVNP